MAQRLILARGTACSQSGGFSACLRVHCTHRTRLGGGGRQSCNKGSGCKKKKKKIVCKELFAQRKKKGLKRKTNTDMGEEGGGSWRRAPPLPTADAIGQPSHSGSAACFHRALNYASLSFHQPQHRRPDKEDSR